MTIHFFSADYKFDIKDKRKLIFFIEQLFKAEHQHAEIVNFIFCSDKFLLKINQLFLKHNYLTDVITFNLAKSSQQIEGEIYISIERVKENAQVNQVTISNEVHRIIFHAILHLCGYRDKTLTEKTIMKKKENKYLKLYFQ